MGQSRADVPTGAGPLVGVAGSVGDVDDTFGRSTLATPERGTLLPMALLNPHYATRRYLKVGLILAGALAGAAFGLLLTRLGKLVTGAEDATLANYVWNAGVFGLVAAVVSPIVSWTSLRSVPLWRTIVEPLAWAASGGLAAVVMGVPALILVLPPVGLLLGFVVLGRRYPERVGRTLSAAEEQSLGSGATTALSEPEAS